MHLQRNAYQNYILLLTNNFKFYILQILGHLNFLSVFFVFAKNQFASLITRRLTLCAFGKLLVLQFREKHQDATARKGFALRPLGKTHCYSGYAFSYALKNKFASLNNNAAHAVCRWQAHCVNISEKSMQGGSLRLTSPQSVRPLGTTPCYSDFASNFEIISRNENYAFNHNNFYHNGNNRIWRLPRLLAKGTPTETKSRNDDFIVCNNGLLSINNGLFSRNDYGGNFIFGFWSNSNFGFLFNRKINSKKNFISEGEKTMKKIFLTNFFRIYEKRRKALFLLQYKIQAKGIFER